MSSSYRPALRLLLLALIGLSLATPALSDDKPGANKALRRAQMEAAKAEQEKAAVEAEKATLSSALEKAQAEARKNDMARKQAHSALAEAKAHADALQAQDEAHLAEARAAMAETVKQANDRFDRYETDIATLRKQLAESDAHGREVEKRAQALDEDKSHLIADLSERSDNLSACTKKNGALFALNAALRKQFQDKGLLSLLRRDEPLTGLARVQEENAMQDVEDKAYDARILGGAR